MAKPAYPGPKTLADALSQYRLQRYRDLGLAAATGGRLGLKHIRAIGGFQGVEGEVTLRAGDALSQPAGVPHNVIARSEDFEVLELNVPAEYGTFDL